MTTTLADVISLSGVDVLAHLDRQITVPVLTGLQLQGDLAVIPRDQVPHGVEITRVGPGGVPVLRGEAGGNTHLLVADGLCMWGRAAEGQDVGVLTVAPGATAYLIHPEHGANAVGGGVYTLRRQREQADEIRLVAD